MVSGVFVGSLLIAGVFAVAGVAKLADLERSREALVGFGTPRRLARTFGILLPLGELGVTALLVVGVINGRDSTAIRAGALLAIALLAGFCAGITINLLRGRAPDCHCFGQLHSAPASIRTLLRNGALLAVASLVASGGDVLWLAAATGVTAVLTAVVAVSSRRVGSAVAGSRSGPAPGDPAPGFQLPSLAGSPVSLEALRARGRPVLIVFTHSTCGPCRALAPNLASWRRRYSHELTIATLEAGDGSGAGGDGDQRGGWHLRDERGTIADAYGAYGTPSAVLVAADGRIGSGVAAGAGQIEALTAKTVGRRWHRPRRRRAGGLARRELLVRGAGGAAAAGAWLSPARALGADRDGLRCNEDGDCGHFQECRGRGDKGRCVCVSSTKPDACGKKCTHFDYSDQNCGGCVPGEGKKCVRGVTTCVSGVCIRGDGSTCAGGCRSGEICCRGLCVTPQLDKRNCTGCGVECGPDEICCGSDGGCRNTTSDPRHCRRCDRICREEEPICYLGDCYKRCPNDLAECKSGRLRTCYEPERQLCCGGRVVSKDSLPEGAECCDDEIVVRPPGSFVCP